MVTSEQVAKLAGVSRATVSRVLNGSTHVSEETKKRIYAAMAELGYEANIFARTSLSECSRVIALALFGSEDDLNLSRLTATRFYFYVKVLEAIERELAKERYDLFLPSRPSTAIDHPEKNYILALRAQRVEGVIALAVQADDPCIQALCRSTIPTVFVDNIFEAIHTTYVKSDFLDGARQATEHLLKLGHRRIAFFPGGTIALTGTERFLGYQQAMARAGLVMDPNLVRFSGWELSEAYQEAMTLLSERRDFTAIVAASDMLALGILRALREHGLRVPEDISLIGFDDINLSQDSDPPLTTIWQDTQALARGSVSRLLRLIAGEKAVEPLVVPTQLIVRASTGSAPERE